MEERNEWLKLLAINRTPLCCKLLSRRKIEREASIIGGSSNKNAKLASMTKPMIDADLEQSAICHVQYRPWKSLFRQDLGHSLVRNGRAGLISSGMHIEISSMPTVDGSTKVGDLQKDVTYLEELSLDEFEAVKERKGMWSLDAIRNDRPDLVEEAEFELNAGIFQKVWRLITRT